jgi:hypothetical protein
VAIAVLAGAGAGTARADILSPDPIEPSVPPDDFIEPAPRRPRLRLEGVAIVLRMTDAGRWEVGAGASGGWRPLLDLHVRYYVSDAVTLGPRLRLDLDGGAPRAAELEIANAIGQGKMLLPGDVMTRTRLVLGWGSGAVRVADRYGAFAFVGLALRVQPWKADWLSFEIGARGALAPREVPVAARVLSPGASPASPRSEVEAGVFAELGASIAVLWPRPRRECVRLPL